jgi:ABC-type phosphonate transport system ATPase subunit
MLHRDIVRTMRIERECQIIAKLHFRRAIEMKTIVQWPLRGIERQRFSWSAGGDLGKREECDEARHEGDISREALNK